MDSRIRRAFVVAIASTFALALACKPDKRPTPPPANAPASQIADSGAFSLVAVGDIGMCGSQGDEETAQLADSVLIAHGEAGVKTEVLTMGDNAYPAGMDRDFVRCFESSWGDRRRQIRDKLHPSIGNHDYQSQRGAAYYRYFGARAGERFKGYYSFDHGGWHLVALSSEIVYYGTDQERREQETWLTQDLKKSSALCTIAYFHRPLFSSGVHWSATRMKPIYEILYANNADLILAGHDHDYERFLPQTPAGVADSIRGIPQIVAGTGGGTLTGFRAKTAPNSAARIQGRYGILVLTLGTDAWRSEFLEVGGRAWDPAGGRCH